MARPNKIAEAAAEHGMSEREFLAHLLTMHATAKEIAAELEISGAAVTMALARNGFVQKSEWVLIDTPAEEVICEVVA